MRDVIRSKRVRNPNFVPTQRDEIPSLQDLQCVANLPDGKARAIRDLHRIWAVTGREDDKDLPQYPPSSGTERCRLDPPAEFHHWEFYPRSDNQRAAILHIEILRARSS